MIVGCAPQHISRGKPVEFREQGEILIYEGWELPAFLSPPANEATLNFYLQRMINDPKGFGYLAITGSASPRSMARNKKPSAYLDSQLEQASILSYLMMEKGLIKYDGLVAANRFKVKPEISSEMPFRSNSVGKSIVSYLLGHAICDGYISSVDIAPDDWPLMEKTLYSKVRLTDLLDMKAGDKAYVSDGEGLKPSGRWYNVFPLYSFAVKELENSIPSKNRPHHYNGLITNVLLNYIIYKTGPNSQKFFDQVFQEHVGIADRVFFFKIKGIHDLHGPANYQFYATKYDYLRIAMTIMDDWKNDTCVGRYLKDAYDRRSSKGINKLPADGLYSGHRASKNYAGQFHFDYMTLEDKKILGMSGYGNQEIMINFDDDRIIVINAITDNYDWKTLALKAMATGQLPE